MDLRLFRKTNDLSQQDLADFLSVGRSFISQIETGIAPLPQEQLAKILGNEEWDCTQLTESDSQSQSGTGTNVSVSGAGNVTSVRVRKGSQDMSSAEITMLRKEIEMLRSQLEEEKARSTQYWDMIQKMMSYGKQ